MKCKECGVEYQSKRSSSRYCSGVCRVNASRNKVSVTDTPRVSVTPLSVTPIRTLSTGCLVSIPGDSDYTGCVVNSKVVTLDTPPVKDMSRVQLQQAIRAYPSDQWIDSPEHKELMRRLHTLSVDQLEAEGYYVPAWKRAG